MQVTKASNVALDPRGQESLRAEWEGKWVGSSQEYSDGQNQMGPHPGGTFRLQRKLTGHTAQRLSFSRSPEETLEDQASSFRGYTW